MQERFADAEPMLKRSVAIRDKANPDNPDIAPALSNLGAVYSNQKRYDLAEPLFKRSLAVLEKARGPDDPELSVVLSNLSDTYINQKRYDLAEPLLKRSLRLAEKLGPNNASVAQALNNLGTVYLYQESPRRCRTAAQALGDRVRKIARPDEPRTRRVAGQSGRALQGPGPLRRCRTVRQARGRHPRQGRARRSSS